MYRGSLLERSLAVNDVELRLVHHYKCRSWSSGLEGSIVRLFWVTNSQAPTLIMRVIGVSSNYKAFKTFKRRCLLNRSSWNWTLFWRVSGNHECLLESFEIQTFHWKLSEDLLKGCCFKDAGFIQILNCLKFELQSLKFKNFFRKFTCLRASSRGWLVDILSLDILFVPVIVCLLSKPFLKQTDVWPSMD